MPKIMRYDLDHLSLITPAKGLNMMAVMETLETARPISIGEAPIVKA